MGVKGKGAREVSMHSRVGENGQHVQIMHHAHVLKMFFVYTLVHPVLSAVAAGCLPLQQ